MSTKVVDLSEGCARCGDGGEDHSELEFQEFEVPVRAVLGEHQGEVIWTHWALCPTTGEPILLRIVEDEEVDRG